jgi:DNA-binding HxlR family transcriptional regulator
MIASALDVIGDRWSLVIIRDMLLHYKTTFKEFIASDEGVATNLLSSRLKGLELLQIISKNKLRANKKENIYLLTDKGINLAPIIMELVVWSDLYVREYHSEMNTSDTVNMDKHEVITQTQRRYQAFADQFEHQIAS